MSKGFATRSFLTAVNDAKPALDRTVQSVQMSSRSMVVFTDCSTPTLDRTEQLTQRSSSELDVDAVKDCDATTMLCSSVLIKGIPDIPSYSRIIQKLELQCCEWNPY